MSSSHTARSRGNSSRATGGNMQSRPYSTTGVRVHGSSRHETTGRHRHSAAPVNRPQSTQPRYVAYRPSQPPIAPQPQRPSGAPYWVNRSDELDSAPVQEMRSHRATYDCNTTPARQGDQPRQQHTGQTFETFLSPQPVRRRNIWVRILCGSGDSDERRNARVVSGDDAPQSRSVQQSQPSASARRRARLAGDPEAPYRTKTGYNAESGQTFYASHRHFRGSRKLHTTEMVTESLGLAASVFGPLPLRIRITGLSSHV
ncbi:hypothetical protein PGQ11_012582 [Apiospora arundinis]|uniref:Uncharacterized protein n=1 Tax=Apiospora arundinis TaxID=335852 RepID=A0ABR2I3V5_9PEZI